MRWDYSPKSEQTTIEREKKEDVAIINVKTRLSADKVPVAVFWNLWGVLHINFLHERQLRLLLLASGYNVSTNKRDLSIQDDIVLRDNPSPHTPLQTPTKLDDLFSTVMEYPTCSPDLSPWDYHMIGPLKERLGGYRFDNYTAMEAFMSSTCFWWWNGEITFRCEKCVMKSEDYMEECNIIVFVIKMFNGFLNINFDLYLIHHRTFKNL